MRREREEGGGGGGGPLHGQWVVKAVRGVGIYISLYNLPEEGVMPKCEVEWCTSIASLEHIAFLFSVSLSCALGIDPPPPNAPSTRYLLPLMI